jgi:hypothetical protein
VTVSSKRPLTAEERTEELMAKCLVLIDVAETRRAIAGAIRAAVREEREACAGLRQQLEAKCERMGVIGGPEEEAGVGPDFFGGYSRALADFAAALRKRGEA